MTKYPAWKKAQIRQQWRSMLAIFLTVILMLAVFNGLLKGISLNKYIGNSQWDNKAAFVVALDTKPPGVFILQKEPREKVAFLTVDEKLFVFDRQSNEKLSALSTILKEDDGEKLTKSLSLVFGANVESYLNFENDKTLNNQEALNYFKKLASFETLIKIISGKIDDGIKGTNITRGDLLRLWWQLKGISVNNVDFANLANLNEEIIDKNGNRVLGADSDSLNREIAKYLENLKVGEEEIDIDLINASGEIEAGKLAAQFINAIGGRILKVTASEQGMQKSIIITGASSYTASYLAKMFDCDIKSAQENGSKKHLQLFLGRDFAQKYF